MNLSDAATIISVLAIILTGINFLLSNVWPLGQIKKDIQELKKVQLQISESKSEQRNILEKLNILTEESEKNKAFRHKYQNVISELTSTLNTYGKELEDRFEKLLTIHVSHLQNNLTSLDQKLSLYFKNNDK